MGRFKWGDPGRFSVTVCGPKDRAEAKAETRAKAARKFRKKHGKKRRGNITSAKISAFYKSPEWGRLRYLMLQKQKGTCQCCGRSSLDRVLIQVDHIHPVRYYWEKRFDPDNLQVLCALCNRGKGNWDLTNWRDVK